MKNDPLLRAFPIEISIEAGAWSKKKALKSLVNKAVSTTLETANLSTHPQAELSLLFTDDAAMQRLNAEWRGKDKPTNVLSFPILPYDEPQATSALGDIVFGFETINREAGLLGISLENHLIHLTVHGFLHLYGYDHETEHQAEVMEDCERKILRTLGIDDPYAL